jgi:hypothetical protein
MAKKIPLMNNRGKPKPSASLRLLLYFAAVRPSGRLLSYSKNLSDLGGAKEIRTPDLLHAMQALYQLSYSPGTAPMRISM